MRPGPEGRREVRGPAVAKAMADTAGGWWQSVAATPLFRNRLHQKTPTKALAIVRKGIYIFLQIEAGNNEANH